jgi:hypothetical protein
MFHGSRAQVNRGERHDGGDPEGWNGERAMRVGYRKQREQDRREHQRAGFGRLGEGAADRGERKAQRVEPPRLPRDRDLAIPEDDFLSLAHRRTLD